MDQHITELEQCIKELNQELDKAKGAVNEAYAIGFGEALQQPKHFFIGKELNFDLLDPTKAMNKTMAEAGQATEQNQARQFLSKSRLLSKSKCQKKQDPIKLPQLHSLLSICYICIILCKYFYINEIHFSMLNI